MSVPYGSLLKEVADCGCGCELAGTLKKANRAGVRCVRGCVCPSCRGRANKRKGQRKQAKAVTALGIPRSSIHPGHEEFLPGALRVEVKATKREAGPTMTAFLRCETQSEAARPVGDHRPFAAVMMPEGTSDGLLVCRLSSLHEVVAAIAENWGAQ